jgi:hypothetical protein
MTEEINFAEKMNFRKNLNFVQSTFLMGRLHNWNENTSNFEQQILRNCLSRKVSFC